MDRATGKVEAEADLFFARMDDEWERTSRVLAMLNSLIVVTVGGGKMRHEPPDHFNDSLKPPEGSPEAVEDDYPWAEPEDTDTRTKNGEASVTHGC